MQDIFKLSRDDLVKTVLNSPFTAGVWLYLTGLLVYQLYLLKYNILSFDLLKPVCILIGFYIFLFIYIVPYAIVTLLLIFKLKQYFLNSCLFVILNTICIYFISSALMLELNWRVIIYALSLSICIFFIYSRFKKLAISTEPFPGKVLIGIILFCFIFFQTIYKDIPRSLGGGQPTEVSVLTDPDTLLVNRFSKSKLVRLLYESEDSYYFKVNIHDSISGILTQISIKKIPKSCVKRINYIYSPFIKF